MQAISRQIQAQNQQLLFPIRQTEDKFHVESARYTDQKKIVAKALITPLNALVSKPDPEDKNIQQARKILGEVARELSPDQLQGIVTEVKFLTDSWLDEFERQLFDGKTLLELLHEKGGI